MTRRVDWQVRLQALIIDWQRAPFQYGKFDCVQLAGAAVEAMTGESPIADLPEYTTEAEGLAHVEAMGLGNYVDLFARHLPEAARPTWGDLAVIDTPDGPAMGVVNMRGVFVMTPDRGLGLAPKSMITKGFAV